MKNKKAQYMPPQQPYTSVHPVLVLGIVLFVLPFLGVAFNWHISKWLSGLGVFVILVGATLSIYNASEQ